MPSHVVPVPLGTTPAPVSDVDDKQFQLNLVLVQRYCLPSLLVGVRGVCVCGVVQDYRVRVNLKINNTLRSHLEQNSLHFSTRISKSVQCLLITETNIVGRNNSHPSSFFFSFLNAQSALFCAVVAQKLLLSSCSIYYSELGVSNHPFCWGGSVQRHWASWEWPVYVEPDAVTL